ncbi:MAG TPA: lytic transglycosylase domain-containing protein [bacterium]|nr:lytic transglycosylase domain-containing protein [bacterium]
MRNFLIILLFFPLFLSAQGIHIPTANMINEKYSVRINESVKKYPYINKAGQKVIMHPGLVKAIIYQESRGVPDAKSHAGAYGLTQIMPQTAKILKCDYDKLNDPDIAIECSTKFLAALLTYNKGDLIKTLSGYNGGTHSTETKATTTEGLLAGRIYNNPETKAYVVSVLRWFEWFKGGF